MKNAFWRNSREQHHSGQLHPGGGTSDENKKSDLLPPDLHEVANGPITTEPDFDLGSPGGLVTAKERVRRPENVLLLGIAAAVLATGVIKTASEVDSGTNTLESDVAEHEFAKVFADMTELLLTEQVAGVKDSYRGGGVLGGGHGYWEIATDEFEAVLDIDYDNPFGKDPVVRVRDNFSKHPREVSFVIRDKSYDVMANDAEGSLQELLTLMNNPENIVSVEAKDYTTPFDSHDSLADGAIDDYENVIRSINTLGVLSDNINHPLE